MPSPTSRLLVADPDRLQLQLIDMLLSGEGFELTLVETGREALEHLKENIPDLCLLALDLPDLPGDEICGKIRRVTRLARTPVVLIAPQAGQFGLSDDARARARKAGADLVLPRPLGDKNLQGRLQSVLDERDSIPEREGSSTRIIEEALDELDSAPTEPEPATPQSRHGPFAIPNEPPVAPATDPASEALASEALAGDAGTSDAGGPTDLSSAPVAIRREIETLRIENNQLRRKLQAKIDELKRSDVRELERRVGELERRNAALLEALEKAKGKGGEGRGLFGRRK